MSYWLRFILSLPLIAFGVFVIVQNWLMLYAGWRRKPWAGSLVPLVGPLSLSAGLICAPYVSSIWLYLLPLALDWGTIPNIVGSAWYYRRRRNAYRSGEQRRPG